MLTCLPSKIAVNFLLKIEKNEKQFIWFESQMLSKA